MNISTKVLLIATLPEAYLPFKPIIDDQNKITKLTNILCTITILNFF